MRYAVIAFLILVGCAGKHPKENDWYVENSTGHQVKVERTGDGQHLIELYHKISVETDFIQVNYWGETREIEKRHQECVATFEIIPTNPRTVIEINLYTLKDFTENFTLSKDLP